MTRAYKLYALGTHLVFTLRRGGGLYVAMLYMKR